MMLSIPAKAVRGKGAIARGGKAQYIQDKIVLKIELCSNST